MSFGFCSKLNHLDVLSAAREPLKCGSESTHKTLKLKWIRLWVCSTLCLDINVTRGISKQRLEAHVGHEPVTLREYALTHCDHTNGAAHKSP